MPMKPKRPCRKPGCSVLVEDGYCPAHRPKRTHDRSDEAESWRWMYRTDEWIYDLRPTQLLLEPFCRICAKAGKRVRATDVDHVVDHKGSWEIFTDKRNLQSLCHGCHSRKTATELWQKRAEKKRRR